MMAHVSIQNLKKSYDDVQTLHGLDLTFEKGEFVVIVGPSGCGKSTLLRMIAGLEDITSGQIALDGQVVNTVDAAQRGDGVPELRAVSAYDRGRQYRLSPETGQGETG